jgi:DNA-binding transcriptional MocR family regulator
MPPAEKSNDFPVAERLESLGISLLSEWDVLVFLYRHGTILTSAAQIAQSLGHAIAPVIAALDRLESLGFIVRSRGSQGVRLCRFSIPADAARCSGFMELMILAEKRQGRLMLLEHLRRDKPPVGRSSGLRLA